MENKIDHIIARVLVGEASAEDIFELSNWLNEDVSHQQEFKQLKNYWDAEISMSHSILPTLSAENLQHKIETQNKISHKKQVMKYLFSLTASITLIVLLSTGYLIKKTNSSDSKYYTYLTNENKTDLTLDDGTRITLNKNSRLTYSDEYGKKSRVVRLEGEAYFDVAKDSLKPFSIVMGSSSITVLGTSFNLKNEINSHNITATLVEGSICFETSGQKVVLKPGQQLTFDQESTSIDIIQVKTEEYTSWKDGLLRYKSIPFVELIQTLKEKYQVEIIIKNKKWMKRDIVVSGSFGSDQDIGQILNIISHSLPFHWTYENGIYYIK